MRASVPKVALACAALTTAWMGWSPPPEPMEGLADPSPMRRRSAPARPAFDDISNETFAVAFRAADADTRRDLIRHLAAALMAGRGATVNGILDGGAGPGP